MFFRVVFDLAWYSAEKVRYMFWFPSPCFLVPLVLYRILENLLLVIFAVMSQVSLRKDFLWGFATAR